MYLKSITLDEQNGNYNGLAIAKANLGIFYFDQGREEEAKKPLTEAFPIARKAGLRKTEAEILKALSVFDSQ